MKSLIDEIKEYQDILLNNDNLNYYDIQNFELLPKGEQNKEDNKNNIEKEEINESEKLKYEEMYKPFFDLIEKKYSIRNREEIEQKEENKEPQKNYKNYVINYKGKKERKNNFNLDDEFGISKNAFNKTSSSTKFNKSVSYYKPKSSYKKENRDKLIEEFKNKYFNKNNNIQNFDVSEHKEMVLGLKNMHNLINKNLENDIFLSNNYKNIINNMNKEIEMIRKERNKENNIFEKKIKIMEDDILNDGKFNKLKYDINRIINIYSSDKNKNSKNKTKRTISIKYNNYKKKNKSVYRSPKKKNIKTPNIHNLLYKKGYSLSKNKTLTQNLKLLNILNNTSKKKKKLKSKNKKRKNMNPSLLYCEKIMNEIKKLDKENKKIEQKYKNLPISEDELDEIIKLKSHNNTNDYFTPINYKKNSQKIKKNLNLISNKIIDDILYECIGELMNIEKQKSKKGAEERLKNNLNYTCINLDEYNNKEKELISKYNKKNEYKGETRKFEMNYRPSKIRNIANLNDEMIKRADIYQIQFLEYMILKGSFYSNFDIFQIYDILIDELSEKIMGEEIDKIIKNADICVENICNDEMKQINQQ